MLFLPSSLIRLRNSLIIYLPRFRTNTWVPFPFRAPHQIKRNLRTVYIVRKFFFAWPFNDLVCRQRRKGRRYLSLWLVRAIHLPPTNSAKRILRYKMGQKQTVIHLSQHFTCLSHAFRPRIRSVHYSSIHWSDFHHSNPSAWARRTVSPCLEWIPNHSNSKRVMVKVTVSYLVQARKHGKLTALQTATSSLFPQMALLRGASGSGTHGDDLMSKLRERLMLSNLMAQSSFGLAAWLASYPKMDQSSMFICIMNFISRELEVLYVKESSGGIRFWQKWYKGSSTLIRQDLLVSNVDNRCFRCYTSTSVPAVTLQLQPSICMLSLQRSVEWFFLPRCYWLSRYVHRLSAKLIISSAQQIIIFHVVTTMSYTLLSNGKFYCQCDHEGTLQPSSAPSLSPQPI